MLDCDEIIFFTRIVEIGSINKAKDKLNTTQSTISRRIKALEEKLGFQIFIRNSRVFSLTENGKQLYEKFKSLNSTMLALLNGFKQNQSIEGTLRVVLPNSLSLLAITQYISEFTSQYPNVKIIVSYELKAHDFIRDNIDIAITSEVPTSQICKLKKLGQIRLKLFATAEYVNVYGAPENPAELKQKHKIVGLLDTNKLPILTYDITELTTNKKQILELNSNIYMRNQEQSLQLAKSNKYIVILWDILGSKHNLIPILANYCFRELPILLIKGGNGVDSQLLLEFSKFLEEKIRNFLDLSLDFSGT